MLYADPGSGAMIWQLLLAFFFGASFFFNRFKRWVAASWASHRTRAPLDATAAGNLPKPLASTTEGK
jgi:hypothetical protein